MDMFNKILVAIDGSTTSRKVFEVGLSLAKTTGASLMLLHILSFEEQDYPSPFIYSDLKYNPNVEPILEAYREQWQQYEQQGRNEAHYCCDGFSSTVERKRRILSKT